MGTFRDLLAYKKGFELAMEIFKPTKFFPPDERFSLTDQIRRSSRSVTICLAEAYRKRSYPAHFVAKITDSDMENTETQGWLDYAFACGYISEEHYRDVLAKSEEVGRLLQAMIAHPEKFGVH